MYLTPTLTVSLPAIVANWRLLAQRFTGEECAAVVKADAYGLGALPVSQALAAAGCHTFFVATLDEALELRESLPDVRILVFHGVQAGEEFAFVAHRLIPVLNSLPQIARWKAVAAEHVHAVSALHIDTAMARMGLQSEEFSALMARDPAILDDCRVGLLLSHFACSPESDHPLNAAQLALFSAARALAPNIPASLCNSGGIFLAPEYHFNLARPGCSLYGIAPQAQGANPMAQVATWQAPILMTRTLAHEQTVGYGASQTLPSGARIATVASGYADGYLRHLSGKAVGYVGDHKVALVGRVTMDMLCFDVTQVPESLTQEGAPLTLLGDAPGIRVDEVATAAGTIGYEILTRIGARVARIYG
ncbi:MAG: alanine racemase [Alphaproteobacteria bacterium]|nr:alanine racemase [Alphaproteobacteria bacterium]